jgi:transposase
VILDNLSTHKSPTVQRWLLRHRRFHFRFTPTYGSWMNLVERFSLPDAAPARTYTAGP